jgi:hypothetical protein
MSTPGDALRMASAGLDYLNSPAAAGLDPAALAGVQAALGQLQSKLTAAHAEVLRRFDAANAHNEDGYGTPGRSPATSATWPGPGPRPAPRTPS